MAETHRYWRLAFYANWSTATGTQIREIEFRATIGGADQASGGTASGSTGTTAAASLAFDNSVANSTSTHWAASHSAYAQSWIAYDFGAPVTVKQWAIAPNSVNFEPRVHGIQYSDDGTTWIEAQNDYQATWTPGSFTAFSFTDPFATGVSATTAGVLVLPGTSIGQAASAAGVYVIHGLIQVRKAVGYAVLQSAGDRIGLQKAQAYAVLNSTALVSIRKATAYAVLFDTTISTVDRRRATLCFPC